MSFIQNSAKNNFLQKRSDHWDNVANKCDSWNGLGNYYHKRMREVYQFLIPKNSDVIEIGCAQGDLLSSLNPKKGVGIDFSEEMIKRAKNKYRDLEFIQQDIYDLDIKEKFDYIILSDLVNDLWDVQLAFEKLHDICKPNTKIIINSYSRLWEMPLNIARKLNLAKPELEQSWMTVDDTKNLLELADLQMLRNWQEILVPLDVPLLTKISNKFLVKTLFKHFAMTNFIIAKPNKYIDVTEDYKVSVVVPTRNEEGNIDNILRRTPELGKGTELIFVEGNSTDNTYQKIKDSLPNYPEKNTKLFQQTGKGKGDAVRLGFSEAEGDILMILDADLTVAPEDLPRFYNAIKSGKAEFVNGVRLVYPMEKEAMRFFNLLGNKFFSLAFSWLLGQSIKDTLCGTKVIWTEDYKNLVGNRSYFGDFDPFGDFDLLFGAAKLNLKILDMPIRYRERTYGDTNIERWKHGLVLLRMVMFAANKIKFF